MSDLGPGRKTFDRWLLALKHFFDQEFDLPGDMQ